MKLSSSMIKSVPTFSEMELSSLVFLLSFKRELSKLEKKKKNPPRKKFRIFREMKLYCSNIK